MYKNIHLYHLLLEVTLEKGRQGVCSLWNVRCVCIIYLNGAAESYQGAPAVKIWSSLSIKIKSDSNKLNPLEKKKNSRIHTGINNDVN